MNRILKVDNLKIKFKNDLILNNISLSLNAGDVYALVGINGSGKTTLLSSLAGLLSPTSGNIFIEEKLSHFSQTSMSFQPTSFYSHLTGNDNVRLLSPDPERALKILNKLDLTTPQITKKKVKTLSFGQKQRLGIAIALSKKAKVYLLDEPTNGLDNYSYNRLVEIIQDMSNKGCCFVIASHEWDVIEQCCNRLGMIINGRIEKELDISDYNNGVQPKLIQIKVNAEFSTNELLELDEVLNANMVDRFSWQ